MKKILKKENLKKTKSGFALIESLVAILILSIITTSAFSAIASSIGSINDVRDELVAYQLANESYEMLHFAKDTAYDDWSLSPTENPPEWPLSGFGAGECDSGGDRCIVRIVGSTVEVITSIPNVSLYNTSEGRFVDSGVTVPGDKISKFSRWITIENTSDLFSKNIAVHVRWESKGRTRNVAINGLLYK
ncbi:MAG: type II secretion system protein [Candidatus Paceibacterota bacterium]